MIVGFLGKGGSGKSTTATQMALHVHARNASVLTIDADHNMDLAYNICKGALPKDMPFFGSALPRILEYIGLSEDEKYDQAFLRDNDARFHIFPNDPCTQSLIHHVDERMQCMVAGPQTDTVLYGQSCSHSLTTPLKVFLPLLELRNNQVVIVDEKAGADGVSTGIVTGIDVGIIVCEAAVHSIKTAQQIAELMDFYDTPYIFVGNKIESDDDKEFIRNTLNADIEFFIENNTSMKRDPGAYAQDMHDIYSNIYAKAMQMNNNDRIKRTVEKFARNLTFQNS